MDSSKESSNKEMYDRVNESLKRADELEEFLKEKHKSITLPLLDKLYDTIGEPKDHREAVMFASAYSSGIIALVQALLESSQNLTEMIHRIGIGDEAGKMFDDVRKRQATNDKAQYG